MSNHDFVSDGFLALIATCLLLLCSILVIALSQPASSAFGLLQ
jgi:hypothetical protein